MNLATLSIAKMKKKKEIRNWRQIHQGEIESGRKEEEEEEKEERRRRWGELLHFLRVRYSGGRKKREWSRADEYRKRERERERERTGG